MWQEAILSILSIFFYFLSFNHYCYHFFFFFLKTCSSNWRHDNSVSHIPLPPCLNESCLQRNMFKENSPNKNLTNCIWFHWQWTTVNFGTFFFYAQHYGIWSLLSISVHLSAFTMSQNLKTMLGDLFPFLFWKKKKKKIVCVFLMRQSGFSCAPLW